MDIKIYVINLQHKIQNKNEMIGKLNSLDFNYEFIDAVNGRELTENYLIENNINISKTFRNPYTNTTITNGEIGCALSHIKAWNKAYQDNVKYPIILEDDVEFTRDFVEVLKKLTSESFKVEYDIIYLSRKLIDKDDGGINCNINENYNLVNIGFSYWLNAYMLNKESLAKLINSNYKQNLIVVDEFIPLLYTKRSSRYFRYEDYNIDKFIGLAVEPQIARPKNNTFLSSETEGQPFYTIKYDNGFYNNQIQLVTVGTDPVDGYKRFVESANMYSFPFVCLGFGKPWGGNDMIKGPGGGHKVVLLKEYLSNFNENDERIIVFSDCYDAVVSCSPDQVIDKFYQIKGDNDIIFSAEAILWPDKNLENSFPDQKTPYKYLNSGGFIGKIKDIKKIITKFIASSDDDQLYYQKIYISSQNNVIDTKIMLDIHSHIFQTLSSHFEYIDIDYSKSKVINKLTHTNPLFIHGNGGESSKLFLNKICNYINLKYRHVYGYKDTHSNKSKLVNLNYHMYPTIYVLIIVEKEEDINNIDNIFYQKYPYSQIEFSILNLTTINIDEYVESLIIKFKTNISCLNIENNTNLIKNYIIELFEYISYKSDYLFIANSTHIITEPLIFEKLICSNLDIVSPMILGKNNNCFSNFWGELDNNGYYQRSFDYFNIINREYRGFFNIPYLSGSIMINSNKYKDIVESIKKEEVREHEISNYDMFLSRIIRTRYNFMHIMNFDNYGYILD